MSEDRGRLKNPPQAGFLADQTTHAVWNHSGDTAPESHRLPHQFPAPAKGFLKRVGNNSDGEFVRGNNADRQVRRRKMLNFIALAA